MSIEEKIYVPEYNHAHVSFPIEEIIEKVILSDMKQNIFITGETGNGKTQLVEQICARNDIELIRVNVTTDTDEYVLIGRTQLVAGETKWQDGAAIMAMKRGCILLLDECDLGSPRLMVLQSILEGKSFYVAKNDEIVYPKKGFRVIATANTKGKGDETLKYQGTNILNEAFLDRFGIMIEHEYPNADLEYSIISNFYCKSLSLSQIDNITGVNLKGLCAWAANIRNQYPKDVDDVISTRRLIDVVTNYIIFGDIEKAVQFCVNRFNDTTKDIFMNVWKICYGEINIEIKKLLDELEALKKTQLYCALIGDYDNIESGDVVFINGMFNDEIDI